LKLDGLAGTDLASLAEFNLTVDIHQALRDDFLAFSSGHDEVDGLEQAAEFNVFTFKRKLHLFNLLYGGIRSHPKAL
jgi:hypothetical protein